MTTSKFLTAQDFSYIITYSFNRGIKLAHFEKAAKDLFQLTRMKLLTAPSAKLPALRNKLKQLEQTHNLSQLLLTENLATYHITASPIATLMKNNVETQQLFELLHRPINNTFDFMCAPLYRDAIAFYNEQHKLVSVLNICFSCEKMVTDAGREVRADTTTYDAMQRYLTNLGHAITE